MALHDHGAVDLPPLSLHNLVSQSTIDPLSLFVVVGAATFYVAGVRVLTERGRRWSRARSASFAFGLVVLLVATQSGIHAYGTTHFSLHVAQHVLIGMVAPMFLALGAPVTLALQTVSRPSKVRLLRVLHSTPVRIVTHPVVATVIFTVSLFVLYFSPLLDLALGNPWAHRALLVHFFLAGCVFYWAVLGLDPVAWKMPYAARLALVLVTVPFHGFLGLGMFGRNPLAPDHFSAVGIDPQAALDQQHLGAGIMWSLGEIAGLIAAAIILGQWMAHDARQARREDDADDRARAAARATTVEHPRPTGIAS